VARFYANENFALPVVGHLRERGHEVLTVLEAGKAEQSISDQEVLSFASDDNRCVLTFNRKHFIRLHGDNPNHAGIIVCTYDPDFVALADRIHGEVSKRTSLRGELLRINRPRR
jgi:predicted nuclease of predicted toxin-antitoxin system